MSVMTTKSNSDAGFVGGLTIGVFGGAILGAIVTLMALLSATR
jgi:hypothetical protein